MQQRAYQTPVEALQATDEFYARQEGFQYPPEKVHEWVRAHVELPPTGRVLDLCCGDGIWSKGIQEANPSLELFGIDISTGAIQKARRLLEADEERFVVGDTEAPLPFADGYFDLVFARGPGLYNQHDMDRPAAISTIEDWHRKLTPRGRFYSIFYSNPELMGTYTPIEQVKLPYNRCPRKTDAVDFRGGKYHHTIRSFLTPFWKARNATVVSYSFVSNQHILITQTDRFLGLPW